LLANYRYSYGLRHTFVTNLCREGVSPQTAQSLARHSDIKLTMNIYTHVAPVEQAAAIMSLPGLNAQK
jgi:site-specific recombinase XerD